MILDRLYEWGRKRRERKIIEAAKKRLPVEIEVSAGPFKKYWVYVNGVGVDWEPSFFAARSKALKIRKFLINKGFQVEEIP